MLNESFDKFTERAHKVLNFAQQEAQRFHHNYIGTEHLLLGLVDEGEGIGTQVLNKLGVSLKTVREQVEFIIGRGDRLFLGESGMTPRAKKVIELAVDEARRLNHHYIGTEHLLLGLVREGEGIAAGVLESLGVNLEKVRTTMTQMLANGKIERVNVVSSLITPTAPKDGQCFFISYRHEEAAEVTQTIAEQFVAAFGAHNIARHIDPAPLGTDVRVFVRQQVRQTTALLLLIGPAWLSSAAEQTPPRIFDTDDEVHVAIEAALRYHKPIIPVLIEGAVLPDAAALPDNIRDIVHYQGTQLRPNPYLYDDIARLLAEIRRIFVEG
ncbi:MAG: TIR domain-containing protein [Ktedonobacterales bacterium]|nr:TIR domain-containing protein [Ktedonobacterales bacterium]